MSSITIDENGLVVKRYQDQREDNAQAWRDKFPNIQTGRDSVAGQIVSIQTDIETRQAALIEAVANTFNPFGAAGEQLSRLAPLMNKRRRSAVASSVTLEVTATAAGATIPAGSLVSSATDQFATLFEVVVAPSATTTVEASAVEFGAIEADAGSITNIDTPVFGWASVINPSAASVGRSREDDGSLRARMLITSAAPSGTPLGIFTALSEIDGVSYASVLINNGDTVDSDGLLPHSVLPVVDGGLDSDIGQALLGSVAAGIDYNDATSVPEADFTTVQVINPANNAEESISFARPTGINVLVSIDLVRNSDYPPDGDAQIRQAVSDFINSSDVGETLYSSRLYSPINTVQGHSIVSVTVETKIAGTPSSSVPVAAYERAQVELLTDIAVL